MRASDSSALPSFANHFRCKTKPKSKFFFRRWCCSALAVTLDPPPPELGPTRRIDSAPRTCRVPRIGYCGAFRTFGLTQNQ